MSKQIYLGLAIHNHQPVGNLPSVFEQVHRQAYEPMVSLLERHPGIRISLHYTGPLLDWLLANQRGFIDRVARLVERGQIEIMTGGYYEPILPAIPDSDKLGQIRKLTDAVKSIFGYQANGLWLAERVWEPHLPKFLAEAGVEYLLVDDSHFNMVGIDEPLGYFVTEEQGRTVKIFPSLTRLRYSIPWKDVGEVLEYLGSLAEEDSKQIAVMGDDGEKFGSWPGTFRYCYEDGWLERMFGAIERNSNWLKIIPLGEYARAFPALGRVYLPTASYPEMMEWALPANKSREYKMLTHQLEAEGRGDIAQFMRGGFWRSFLVKYPEINTMHKKMLHVHNKVRDSLANANGVSRSGDERRQRALEELWKGQCNCPYWHGVFGGSYINDIRTATFQHLIAAEKIVDEIDHGVGNWMTWQLTDFDGDGEDELLVESDIQNLYIDLADGGSVFEWDFAPVEHNLTSTMTRRPEAYHQTLIEESERRERERARIDNGSHPRPDGRVDGDMAEDGVETIHHIVKSKEAGLEKKLFYDWYRRSAMIDHFMLVGTEPVDFYKCNYAEQGDFVNQPFRCEVREGDEGLSLLMRRDGHVWQGPEFLPLTVERALSVRKGHCRLSVAYKLTNSSAKPQAFYFGSEWNFNLLGGGHNDNAYYEVPGRTLSDWHGDSIGEMADVNRLRLGNRWLGFAIDLEINKPAMLWRFPIETVSNSEAGFERVYQGSCICPVWSVNLPPGASWTVNLEFTLERQ